MNSYKAYIKVCKGLGRLDLPKLRFKELKEKYRILYKKLYKIEEDDINKASFIIFLISILTIFIISFFLVRLNFAIIISVNIANYNEDY